MASLYLGNRKIADLWRLSCQLVHYLFHTHDSRLNELFHTDAPRCIQANNSIHRIDELHLFLFHRVRSMVGTDHINSPVSEPLYHRIDITLCAQRRVHFYIGIKVSSSDLFIREIKMVSANFRCDMNALRLGTANQLDSLCSTDVCDMYMAPRIFRQ